MIQVQFPAGARTVLAGSAYQWDFGQSLHILGLPEPEKLQAHFWAPGEEKACVVRPRVEDGCLEADIPDWYLQQAEPIAVYLYEEGENWGATEYLVRVPVIPRAMPADLDFPERDAQQIHAALDRAEAAARRLEALLAQQEGMELTADRVTEALGYTPARVEALTDKLDKQQGAANAGKVLTVAPSGLVQPMAPEKQEDTGKLSIAQGAGNAGKFLTVGADGNVTLTALSGWTGGAF